MFIYIYIYIYLDGKTEEYCCYGYCIDLIKTLSTQLEFDYELYMVPDGLYGDIVHINKKFN